jgi:membrane associated rhomboid family serine protease
MPPWPAVIILKQMPSWTEEANFPPAPAEPAPSPAALSAVSVSGVPWATIVLLLSCFGVLFAAGGIKAGLNLPSLLLYGAKATPLILDRGETWRLLSANLLHKDLLHLAFNAFAIWNVGGALERAVRPADYLALLIFTALGTTVVSAVGSDSISLGASGMAFGVLGASAAFGWRRGVRGSLRAHFGLRIVPWLLALFAAGLGSTGVDNWGHAGGLLVGAGLGAFLCPRGWAGEGAARRLAAATGALLGTISIGVFAAPALPALGSVRDGPLAMEVRMPLGWRKAGTGPDRISYTNGLSSTWRSSATLFAGPACSSPKACSCAKAVRSVVQEDLWRLADAGALRDLRFGDERPVPGGATIEGTLVGTDGQMQVSAVCLQRELAPVALIVMQSSPGGARLAERMAKSLAWPGRPGTASLEAGAGR